MPVQGLQPIPCQHPVHPPEPPTAQAIVEPAEFVTKLGNPHVPQQPQEQHPEPAEQTL